MGILVRSGRAPPLALWRHGRQNVSRSPDDSRSSSRTSFSFYRSGHGVPIGRFSGMFFAFCSRGDTTGSENERFRFLSPAVSAILPVVSSTCEV